MAYKDRPERSAKEAQREASRRHYQNNKGAYKARNRRLRRRMRDHIAEAKAAPCMDCGQTYPPYVMDFDHRDPAEKRFDIGNAIYRGISWKQLKNEIGKCDVVCANCHRIRTHGGKPGVTFGLAAPRRINGLSGAISGLSVTITLINLESRQ